jgi:hypothetical protein
VTAPVAIHISKFDIQNDPGTYAGDHYRVHPDVYSYIGRLVAVARAAAVFEGASHNYPVQTSFWLSDQKAFLSGQQDLAEALKALGTAKG